MSKNKVEITLSPLGKEDREQFIKGNQKAFKLWGRGIWNERKIS